MNTDKNIFQEQQLHAIRIADIYNPDVIKRIKSSKNNLVDSKLPLPDSIFNKDIVVQNDPSYNQRYKPFSSKNQRKKKDYLYDDYEVYEENYKYSDSVGENYYSGEKYWKNSKNSRRERVVVNYRKSSDTYSNSNMTSAMKNNKKLNSLFKQKESKEKEGNELIDLEKINKNEVEEIEENSENDKMNDNNSDSNEQKGKRIMNKESRRMKKMFEKQERSRFKFAENPVVCEEKVNIPDYISEIIKKKISLHYFIRKYSFDFDDKLEEELLSNIISDDWIQFIQTLKQNCTVN